MKEFSKMSKFRLATCHPDLQVIFNEVLQYFDCTILEGYRGKEAQEAAFAAGKSKLHFPNGKHNNSPSMAVDASPWPIPDWKAISDFVYFAGFVQGIACKLLNEGKISHKIRYGGDWNMNERISDNNFNDFVHFEIYTESKDEST